MMRSLYSGVSGLKTHQTKMDVIGNNIANVNTVAFKSSSVTFNDIMYQTTQMASGANELTGAGGINAKQIGLGVSLATTTQNISTAGANQTTGSALDCKINGNSFFIVSDGSQNFFTRAGSFYFDSVGNLCMASTGYNVMGWQVDPSTGEIKKDTVSALRIMNSSNLTSPPEATTNARVTGVLDKNSTLVNTDSGYIMSQNFYDDLGYQYTAKFRVVASPKDGVYNVSLTDILDSKSKSILEKGTITAGDLFGVADSNTTDTGVLLAGRSFNHTTSFKDFINIKNNNALQTAEPTIKILDDNGIEDTSGTITMSVVYFTSTSNGKLINTGNDDGYFYTDGKKFYALAGKTTDTDGTVSEMSFIPLSSYNDDYENAVSLEKTRIRKLFESNFAGVNPGIYFDGNSEWSDETEYYDVLTINANKFKTKPPYRLVHESDDTYSLYKDGVLEKSHAAVGSLGNYLKDPTIFETLMTQGEIDDLISAPTTRSIENGLYDTFAIGVKGTSYYSQLEFNTDDGKFVSIGKADSATLALANISGNFKNIAIDFTGATMFNNGGTSTLGMDRGAKDGVTGAGKKLGAMTGVTIDTNGMIYGSYDNGNTVLLGQIATAKFANASGLEQVGTSCYQTTLNSGEFDGIGQDVTADGGSIATGTLEMSNVDLSNEFTDMITTQRGFQANSRIITTSDTLLEELINLKR